MKVLLLTQFFSTTKGGGEYVFSMIAQLLAKNGNKVWIITNKIKNEVYPVHENIKFVFVEPVLEYKGGLPPAFSDNIRYVIGGVKEGLSIIKKQGIDLIHSNNFSPALTGAILSTLTSKPHVTTVHDVFSLCGKNYWKMWAKQNDVSRINALLAPFFEKLIIKMKCNAIHTVSEATKDDLIRFGAKKPIYVIPNSIEIFSSDVIKQKTDHFLYLGRLVFYKNLEVAIKAIRIVKETHPSVKLTIAGGGPHRKDLEEITSELGLENNVRFTGFVSTEEKSDLLSASRALVFPSLCEGFGLVILEAFANRKPALVSDLRPMSDIVTNRVTGFLLPPNDEKKWAEALTYLLDNPEDSIKMGNNGRRLLEDKYGIQNMVVKVNQMYKDQIKK